MLGRRGFAAVVRTQYEIATGVFRSDSKIGLQAKEVTAAATWLRDTAGFKPPSNVDVTSQGESVTGGAVLVALDPSAMSDAQLDAMAGALAAAEDGDAEAREEESDCFGGEGTLGDPGPTAALGEEEPDGDDELSMGVVRRSRGPSN
jgi:hypothetical protein